MIRLSLAVTRAIAHGLVWPYIPRTTVLNIAPRARDAKSIYIEKDNVISVGFCSRALTMALIRVVMLVVALTVMLAVFSAEGSSTSRKRSDAANSRERAEAMLKQMTTEEKFAMLHGTIEGKRYIGWVPSNDRLGIPSIRMNDGPQGFRDEHHPGTSTAWPSGLNVGATWDPELAYKWGEAMGKEFLEKGANVLLGPGMNVARVPVNGRNFEYVSGGDPYLGYSMVGRIIDGIQEQGVIANAKHWVENSQETDRTTIDENVDERTRHEIYYQPFEGAVESEVGSFMCSYNKVNTMWSCENPDTLKGDLKGSLGFEGWVMSDWTATHSLSINAGLDQEMPGRTHFGPKALQQALDDGTIEMSTVDDSVLRILTPMYAMGIMDRTEEFDLDNDVTSDAHTALAKDLSAASHVLLKNEDGALPIEVGGETQVKIAMVGSMARQPIVGGGGSGAVYPKKVDTPYSGLMDALGLSDAISPLNVTCSSDHKNWGYEQAGCMGGFDTDTPDECAERCASFPGCAFWSYDVHKCVFTPTAQGRIPLPGGQSGECKKVPPPAQWACTGAGKGACVAVSDGTGERLQEALELVKEADVVVVPIGTFSGEGNDRESLGFERTQKLCQLEPEESQDELVRKVAKAAKEAGAKVVVAMVAPGAALTPWRDEVSSILHGFMPGQSYGAALAAVLLGKTNPSGRLPMTMPNVENEMQMTPEQYPGVDRESVYTEGLLVDYRWYNAKGVKPAFAFGHGLSYSSFEYSGLTVTPLKADAGDGAASAVSVRFTVTNTSPVTGREVPQLYLTFPSAAEEPPLSLKAFTKTASLEPQASAQVEFVLRNRDVSVWSTEQHAWEVLSGDYRVSVGASSEDLRLDAPLTL